MIELKHRLDWKEVFEMVYEIVLNDGRVVRGFARDSDDILDMMLRHDIYIIQENSHPEMTTYILPDKVSHFRFPSDGKSVVRPVK